MNYFSKQDGSTLKLIESMDRIGLENHLRRLRAKYTTVVHDVKLPEDIDTLSTEELRTYLVVILATLIGSDF